MEISQETGTKNEALGREEEVIVMPVVPVSENRLEA
jgi:hypothetical protein